MKQIAKLMIVAAFAAEMSAAPAGVTEVTDYDSLFSALNNPETAEVSLEASVTLGGNGLSITGSHELELNQYDLRQGTSSGFRFSDAGSGTPVLGITGDGITSSQFTFNDLVNTGTTYGTIRLTDITNASSDSSGRLNNISGMTLALDHTTIPMGDTLSVTAGGLYVDQNSTLFPAGSLNVSENSTVEIQLDYMNDHPTTIDQSTMYVNGNFIGALTASNLAGVTITGNHKGDMEVSGLSSVQVAGETQLDGNTLTVKGSQVDEDYGTQYRSILSTPQIKGNGTLNLSEGGLLTANDGDDETASASDNLLIQSVGGDLTLNVTTALGGYIQPAGALTFQAAGGNNLNVNWDGEGWIQPQAGNLSLLAASGSTLTIDAKGVCDVASQTVGQAVFAASADTIVGGDGEVNVTLGDAASLESSGSMTLGTGSGTVNVTLDGGSLGGTSSSGYADVVLGQSGKATLTGNGSIAAENLIVGQKDGSEAELDTTGSIYARNLVAGKEAGSTGTVVFGGSGSTFVLYGSDSPPQTDLAAEGDGSITLKDLRGADESGRPVPCAIFGTNAQMAARQVMVIGSFLQVNAGSKIIARDVTLTNSFVNASRSGLNVQGNLTFDESVYSLVLNPDGSTVSPIAVTGGALMARNGSELRWSLTGDVTNDTEWAVATADRGVSGEWKLPADEFSPDKKTLFRHTQRIGTDPGTGAATLYLGVSLFVAPEVSVAGCTNVYDGAGHTIRVETNAIPGATLRYAIGGDASTTRPEGRFVETSPPVFTDVTNVTVFVEISGDHFITTTNSAAVMITKADNAWVTEPSMAGWTVGAAPAAPNRGKAKFGTATVTYGIAGGAAGALGATRPSAAGNYVATFTVPETENYGGLVKDVSFTIAAAPPPTPPSPAPPKPTTYTVKFNANGGKLPKGRKMDAQTFTTGTAKKLRGNTFKRKGYVFAGWAKTKNGPLAYRNKQKVKNLGKAGQTVTLYAVWAKKTYKVVFDASGGRLPKGRKMSKQTFIYGQPQKLRRNQFERKGYVFVGWAIRDRFATVGKVAYKDGQKVKNLSSNGKTVKLYAVWKKR